MQFVPKNDREEKIYHLAILQNILFQIAQLPGNLNVKNATLQLMLLQSKLTKQIEKLEFNFECPYKCIEEKVGYYPSKLILNKLTMMSCPNCYGKIELMFTKDDDFIRLSVSKKGD